MTRTRVLFLCTGNACRSQMAEGWMRHLAGERFEVRSAGLEAHGLDPRAVAVMREAGVDISAQTSDALTPEMQAWADVLITVCSHADAHCPAVPSGCETHHWPFADPAALHGSEEDVMDGFRSVRDAIRARIEAFLSERR